MIRYNLPILFLTFGFFFHLNAQKMINFSKDDIIINYQQFILDNGLKLIVHEDHKAPIIAVNIWYHVGSKNEPEGKSGFAHLFEHLMFNGSEHFNDDYFQALEKIGATELNGTTNYDRTNYFQNVPIAALDRVLWLESDRMGHLTGAIDQEKLDEQRGVVQNEKRQGQNRPYGKQYELMTHALWPEGHPYSWTVIGSMDDLNAASLDDVHEWFKTYYGAANAVVVIAGDITAEEAYQKVNKYFGNIPSGPTIHTWVSNVPVRMADTRQEYHDRVPEARISKAWIVPERGTYESVMLNLASQVLSSGKNSRLYKKLVYEDQVASAAWAYNASHEIAGKFEIGINVKPDYEVGEVENMLDTILEEFLTNGPTEAELDRLKLKSYTDFINRSERIGGFGGKSDLLASNMVYGGSPDYYLKEFEWIDQATPEEIKKVAQKYLKKGSHTLICNPFPELAASGQEVDRSELPPLDEQKSAIFPQIEKEKLENGMEIYLARRKESPKLVFNLMFNAGYASDQLSKPGVAKLAMDMMDEGTKSYTSLEINEHLQILGSAVYAYSDLDQSYLILRTLDPVRDEAFDIFTEVILSPSFPRKEFDRLKKQQQLNIQKEKSNPSSMAMRVIPKLIYGPDHPYNLPLTGSGFDNTVSEISLNDIQDFHETWIRPNNAKLIVVGDISMEEVKSMINKKLNRWEAKNVPEIPVGRVLSENKKKIFLIDKPESVQSLLIAGTTTKPYGAYNEQALEMMMSILGGQFTSRINMNLREDKHWSYGASSFIFDTKLERPLMVYTSVQSDKTMESIREIAKEFHEFTNEKPVTDEEFEKVKNNAIMQMAGRWETNAAVAGSMMNIYKYNLGEDYYNKYPDQLKALNVNDLKDLAKKTIDEDELCWVVVGDREKIYHKLRETGYEIVLIDADGIMLNPAKTSIKME